MKKKKNKFYLNENDGMLFGVCEGLGDYFDLDPLLFRIAFVLIPSIQLLYFVIAICASRRPG